MGLNYKRKKKSVSLAKDRSRTAGSEMFSSQLGTNEGVYRR